ncbi:hypothetical protein NKI94_24535 [Mesorhizobium australicum]|uniref:hypothetical protein n=1 Tax=Mesorhizobium australicum TaxID=536018 RepID=UPI0033367677
MANGKQSAAKRLKMAERAEQQMSLLFPDYAEEWVWRRKTNDGYTTLPRTLPIAMQAIDLQSKGTPAGHTLFCLWARSPDHPLVAIENPATFAAEAGFAGERAVDTWRKRMKRLRDLLFIDTKPGASGEFHFVLLLNPNAAVETMRSRGEVQDIVYSRFVDRLTEVGGYAEVEALHEYNQELEMAEAKAEAKAKAKAKKEEKK